MAFSFPKVTRLLGGEMFIDSSGSGVGQLQVKWLFYFCPCTIAILFSLEGTRIKYLPSTVITGHSDYRDAIKLRFQISTL